jgi:valyl-tRNA synthetase
VKSLTPSPSPSGEGGNTLAVKWFSAKLHATVAEVNDHFSKFRISDALTAIYKLIWDDFCSQYLEMIKPAYGSPIDQVSYDATIRFFEKLMTLTHPFMPFITEEIWQEIRPRAEKMSICVAEFPKTSDFDTKILADFEILIEVVSNIRNLRNAKGISPKLPLPLSIKTQNAVLYQSVESLLMKMANVEAIRFVSDKAEGTSFLVKADEFFVNLAGEIDAEEERANLQKDLDYTIGFKKSVEAKLANERFVQNAKPELVEKERQKLADADAKIKAIEESLVRLG